MGAWIRKAVECFKWGLLGHTSRTIEERGAEVDLNYVSLDQDISEVKDFSMLSRNRSCDILATFCPCLENPS